MFEAVTVGEASIAVALGSKEGGPAPAVSLMVIFNANPGTTEIDLQEATTDADGCYLTPSGAAYKLNSFTQQGTNYVAFIDNIPTGGKSLRAKVVAFANFASVNMLAKLSRLA